MVGDVVPLWTFGLACLLAAVVGEALEAGGIRMPALQRKEVRIAVALVGVVALVLGLVAFRSGHSSNDSGPAPSPSASLLPPPAVSTTAPAPVPSPTPTTTPLTNTPTPTPTLLPPTPTTVAVRWQGTLVLDGDALETGWALDPVPPSREPAGDLGLSCLLTCDADELAGNALVAWTGSGLPSREQCRDLLNTQLGNRQLDVQTGSVGCAGTQEQRIARFKVLSANGGRFSLSVTVWQLPPD
ncbi:hypothetical protein ABZ832_03795 [Streptantibioticus parmotrematis]|uniref:hypothetical protein n=1 Tax=Streptantibioticus parmotrematis TaxID=2873249 RepID=UPI0033DBA779